eukprot:CAMPEP_0115229056 /NCGR_PEP_ID=MMETSP0270-20121206/31993_1 /TAXON_ID=71861 /ORGANISM="Scrippsiella trochoidea, Strain CCMP3099" /LENGTH=150 /DNA_ID=CAMNT_0002643585 /DNA_START=147 /DNA_END=600 /DNA_ORIENTATION=-
MAVELDNCSTCAQQAEDSASCPHAQFGAAQATSVFHQLISESDLQSLLKWLETGGKEPSPIAIASKPTDIAATQNKLLLEMLEVFVVGGAVGAVAYAGDGDGIATKGMGATEKAEKLTLAAQVSAASFSQGPFPSSPRPSIHNMVSPTPQ